MGLLGDVIYMANINFNDKKNANKGNILFFVKSFYFMKNDMWCNYCSLSVGHFQCHVDTDTFLVPLARFPNLLASTKEGRRDLCSLLQGTRVTYVTETFCEQTHLVKTKVIYCDFSGSDFESK